MASVAVANVAVASLSFAAIVRSSQAQDDYGVVLPTDGVVDLGIHKALQSLTGGNYGPAKT